ncbi:MAG: basic amino acid/polyamine antiporter, family [Solirubrobacteraceae bacterium]|jgi:APA family basic amino acid/polyamine antiporter|nr:basic amino acid/polyamine antiporter, family [Solirubrobacteraceae bacterium]
MPRTASPGVQRLRNARVNTPEGLRRGLGSPALFGIVQGFVSASLYFGVGVVAQRALGLTWVVFLVGFALFTLVMVSYVEGASLHQERGGATVIARYAFNELWSFIAGWAICLDYLILIALTAFAVSDYAAIFWAPLAHGVPEFLVGFAVVAYVTVNNVRGMTARRYDRAVVIVLVDLVLQIVLVALGMALLFEPQVLTDPTAVTGRSTSLGDLVWAIPLVLVAFSGIDASSGLSGQVAVGRKGLKRLVAVRLIATLIPYVGIALVASSTLPVERASEGGPAAWIEAPMLGVVADFSQPWLHDGLRYLVAVSAIAILVAACQAAMLGLSRLGYSLALNRQIPSLVGYLHPRYGTPVAVIVIGSLLATILLMPANMKLLLGISAFGTTLAFTLVCLAVCRLRWKEPGRDRPYKVPLNVRVRGFELPLPAAAGAVLCALALLAVLAYHGGGRWVGLGWMAFGIAVYAIYRISEGKSLTKRVTVPERTLTRERPDVEYGSILVPIVGEEIDDDIVQTAGRLAADEDADLGEGGAVIEAIWVFEVPMALPLDSRVPDKELKRARSALARAKAVGEEYEGVEVATAVVRARRAGEAIVHEAKRRGVEAIVLAAEEPTRLRGGLRYGGKQGLRDTFVGETTRYVVQKAPCRVILTAPPAHHGAIQDPATVADERAPVSLGHPATVTVDATADGHSSR